MNTHNEQQAASKALQRIRTIASQAGTEQQHGPQFVAGMRRAANLLEKAIAATPAAPVAAAPVGDLFVECRQCEECNHAGVNDSGDHLAACLACYWSGMAPDEDRCPECDQTGCMSAACPKCGARYKLVASAEFPASTPAAPAVTDPVAAYERELAAGATHEHALHAICTPAAPADLIERCREILAWQRTGVLPGDALRAYANARWPDEHDPLQIAEKETAREAFRILATAAAAITPAAPGIDLTPFRVPVEFWRDVWRGAENHFGEPDSRVAEADRLLALIDASPKGALNEQFGSAEGLDSPKGSSAVAEHADKALAHLSNALEDLESSPDQRPVPLIREAMWHVRQMQAGDAPAYTTGHCENHKKPGGCPLHNLQCGYPRCDRRHAGDAEVQRG